MVWRSSCNASEGAHSSAGRQADISTSPRTWRPCPLVMQRNREKMVVPGVGTLPTHSVTRRRAPNRGRSANRRNTSRPRDVSFSPSPASPTEPSLDAGLVLGNTSLSQLTARGLVVSKRAKGLGPLPHDPSRPSRYRPRVAPTFGSGGAIRFVGSRWVPGTRSCALTCRQDPPRSARRCGAAASGHDRCRSEVTLSVSLALSAKPQRGQHASLGVNHGSSSVSGWGRGTSQEDEKREEEGVGSGHGAIAVSVGLTG